MNPTTLRRRLIRHIARLGWYAIPFYPLCKACASIKQAVGSGIDLRRAVHSLVNQRKNCQVVTFRQAIANRPADAISIETIEYLCLIRKRAALAGGFLSLCFLFGSLLAENYASSLLGMLFVLICCLLVVKHDHRLWQIEMGRCHPDQELGSLRVFFSMPGIGLRLLNPQLFRRADRTDKMINWTDQ